MIASSTSVISTVDLAAMQTYYPVYNYAVFLGVFVGTDRRLRLAIKTYFPPERANKFGAVMPTYYSR